ncbi:MAG: SMI1/KNR4 family protein [Oscillospiraceae bacterium]|nr:SMI1/KNR4 family protein [Oscillospiraceae bacterium]
MLITRFDNTDVEKYIVNFERKYNIEIPCQYREFLLAYNGGETLKTDFRSKKISSDINGFYGLGFADADLNYSFFEETGTLINYLKDNMLPIGSNVFGDHILIGIDGDNLGKIYFYYHDRPTKYIELAEDFKVFVAKCKSEKLGHIMTIEERAKLATEKGHKEKIPKLIPHWQAEIDRFSNVVQEELIL